MTRRSDIVKIFAIAAVMAMVFYYLAHFGLACPENVCDVRGCALGLLAQARRSFERCRGQSCCELHESINSAWAGSLNAAMRQNCIWLLSLVSKVAVVAVAFAFPGLQSAAIWRLKKSATYANPRRHWRSLSSVDVTHSSARILHVHDRRRLGWHRIFLGTLLFVTTLWLWPVVLVSSLGPTLSRKT
jgi:hypothetical protein